jgi:hypothetical protein
MRTSTEGVASYKGAKDVEKQSVEQGPVAIGETRGQNEELKRGMNSRHVVRLLFSLSDAVADEDGGSKRKLGGRNRPARSIMVLISLLTRVGHDLDWRRCTYPLVPSTPSQSAKPPSFLPPPRFFPFHALC